MALSASITWSQSLTESFYAGSTGKFCVAWLHSSCGMTHRRGKVQQKLLCTPFDQAIDTLCSLCLMVHGGSQDLQDGGIHGAFYNRGYCSMTLMPDGYLCMDEQWCRSGKCNWLPERWQIEGPNKYQLHQARKSFYGICGQMLDGWPF